MAPANERFVLRIVVFIAALVPVSAGLLGAADSAFLSLSGPPQAYTHIAYLSGLLLGIGLAFLSCLPRIETQTARFTLLTLIVVVGGLCRALAMLRTGTGDPSVWLALGMELAVTPLLWLWQRRVAALFGRKGFSFRSAMPMFRPSLGKT